MEYLITYKKIKHGYVRLINNQLHISIPNKFKNDESFLQKLLDKGKSLFNKKKTEIKVLDDNYVILFGEQVTLTELPILSNKKLVPYLKELLLDYAKPLIGKYATKLGKSYKSIHIRKTKSKRGSCTADQRIFLNLDLVHLSTKYIHYVIVHEVCHLSYKHHKPSFWQKVEELSPNYKQIRKEMRDIVII